MKKNKLHRKSNSAIYAQSFKSGKDFVELRREAVERDLIPVTRTAKRRKIARDNGMTLKEVELDFLHNCEDFVASNPTHEILSNSSGSASKATVTLDGHHLNPLQQAKDASARVVEYRNAFNEMVGLFNTTKDLDLKNKMYNFEGEQIYAYNITFSFTNSDKGRLSQEVDTLNKMVSSFWKRLKDAYVRNGKSNRLAVASDETGYAAPIGMLIANEVTINSEKLLAMNGTKIFHPHIHATLFTDKKLSNTIEDDMYALWDSITGSKYTDQQAFKFEKAYSKSAGDNASIVDSLKETTKYLMDPSKWDIISLNEKDPDALREFKIEVFAEYFKSYSDIKRLKTLGLLRDARSFINRFDQFKNASIFNKSDILGDILTQLNELRYNHYEKKYEFNHVRQLTDDEVLHENKSYLKNILVSEDYKKELDNFAKTIFSYLPNDKDKLFSKYFREKEFNSSLDELYEIIDEEVREIDNNKHKLYVAVFDPVEFRKEYGESFKVGDYDHFRKYQALKEEQLADEFTPQEIVSGIYFAIENFGKACDAKILKHAINSLINYNGTSVTYSRDEIDARIFEKRLAYRQALNMNSSDKRDAMFSNMFYQENGMTLPFDGRSSETFDLYVEETNDAEEIFDLFRVPEDARPRLSVLLGLVKPDHRTAEYLTQDYILGEELLEATRDYARKNERSLRPSRWGNPFEPLPFSEVGQPDKEAVGV